MANPSSTSSSDPARFRFPWAALSASALILGGSWKTFAARSFWVAAKQRLERLPEGLVRLEAGRVQDNLELARLAEAPGELVRVVVVGNSRARVGLRFPRFEEEGVRLAKLAHATVSPFVMRSLAPDVAGRSPDLVVLMLSELDTQRPVTLVPGADFGRVGALAELLLAEPGVALSQRVEVERIAVGCGLDAYRYRDVLERAWLNDLRTFPLAELAPERTMPRGRRGRREVPRRGRPGRSQRVAVDPRYRAARPASTSKEPDVGDLAERVAELEADPTIRRKRVDPKVVAMLLQISEGSHRATQEGLVRRTVELLSEAGSDVLIVEGPLHPTAYRLYDREPLRGRFLAFVEGLRREFHVHWLPLEESGPFEAEDFADLLHLAGNGADRLSAVVRSRILEISKERRGR